MILLKMDNRKTLAHQLTWCGESTQQNVFGQKSVNNALKPINDDNQFLSDTATVKCYNFKRHADRHTKRDKQIRVQRKTERERGGGGEGGVREGERERGEGGEGGERETATCTATHHRSTRNNASQAESRH